MITNYTPAEQEAMRLGAQALANNTGRHSLSFMCALVAHAIATALQVEEALQ